MCSNHNLELVRMIGADHVIDYYQVDFTQKDECYDLIFDIVANRSISDNLKGLTPERRYVAGAFNPSSFFSEGCC